jgi:hypothetical protein
MFCGKAFNAVTKKLFHDSNSKRGGVLMHAKVSCPNGTGSSQSHARSSLRYLSQGRIPSASRAATAPTASAKRMRWRMRMRAWVAGCTWAAIISQGQLG